MTYQRIQQQIAQHNASFWLPFLGIHLTSTEIKAHINQAERHLKKCQKDSQGLRHRCYHDILAMYANDDSPEIKRKFRFVHNTIKSEQCRSMYKNIRNTVKPQQYGGLHCIMAPRHKDSINPPSDYQAFLSTTEDKDIKWDTILDKKTIETNLIRFNRNHFRAASASPCGGKGAIHDQLTFTSLSPHALEMLNGNIPDTWYGNDKLLREFLTSFTIPDRIKDIDPISIEITTDDVKYGFGKWKESTSTSPSGRHLGHYKAIIQDDLLLNNLTKFMQIVVESGMTLTRWCNAVNIMIEKDHGQPKITRLRIIHLFEADFNFFLKLQWGSRLVKRAVQEDLLNDGQHGRYLREKQCIPSFLRSLQRICVD
jgi:hypothetical protein